MGNTAVIVDIAEIHEEAGEAAYADVLSKDGFEAHAGSRLD